jgi:hypothetical protein
VRSLPSTDSTTWASTALASARAYACSREPPAISRRAGAVEGREPAAAPRALLPKVKSFGMIASQKES